MRSDLDGLRPEVRAWWMARWSRAEVDAKPMSHRRGDAKATQQAPKAPGRVRVNWDALGERLDAELPEDLAAELGVSRAAVLSARLRIRAKNGNEADASKWREHRRKLVRDKKRADLQKEVDAANQAAL